MLTIDRACFGMDPNIFYPTESSDEERAIAICEKCPDQETCLRLALRTKEKYGVWGGTTRGERDYIVKTGMRVENYLKIKCGTEQGLKKHLRMHQVICGDCLKVARRLRTKEA